MDPFREVKASASLDASGFRPAQILARSAARTENVGLGTNLTVARKKCTNCPDHPIRRGFSSRFCTDVEQFGHGFATDVSVRSMGIVAVRLRLQCPSPDGAQSHTPPRVARPAISPETMPGLVPRGRLRNKCPEPCCAVAGSNDRADVRAHARGVLNVEIRPPSLTHWNTGAFLLFHAARAGMPCVPRRVTAICSGRRTFGPRG